MAKSIYKHRKVSGHPLTYANGCGYEHRILYFNAHGVGPFSCHWCGKEVTWATLHIDHLDDDGMNNDLSNLVTSCPLCNQRRGRDKWMSTWRAKSGVTVNGVTKTVNEWAEEMGISRPTIQDRLRKGWTPEAAVLTPRGKFGPKRKAE